MSLHVLRMGHRVARDKRVTTHCCLVARAFGAEKVIYTGQRDQGLEYSVGRVVHDFGGPFSTIYIPEWKKPLTEFQKQGGKVVHLTVYGLPLQKAITHLRKEKNLLVVVGGEKVPSGVYHMADWNVSVTSQPHSEIAALSVFLHAFFQGTELSKKFTHAKKKVIPQERGKKVITLS